MSDSLSILLLLIFEAAAIILILILYEIRLQNRVTRFKQIIRNALIKNYLNDETLEDYALSQKLKHEQVLSALLILIIELEAEEGKVNDEKIEQLRQVRNIYQKTGFLSTLPSTIRHKMRTLAKLNTQYAEIIFQLAQEIHILHLTDKKWKKIGVVISILSTSIALWNFFPDIIRLFPFYQIISLS